MAKTQDTTTRSPQRMATGAEVYAEDAVDVIEMLNYVFGYRPQPYVVACTSDSGLGTGAVKVTSIYFQSALTLVLTGKMRVNPDVVTLVCGARCYMNAANTGDVVFTIGAASTTIGYTATNNGAEQSATLATSSTGTGLLTWTIQIDRTAGAAADNLLRNVRIEAQRITSSLPSPLDENGTEIDFSEDYAMTPRQEAITTQAITGTDTAITDTLNNTPVSNASVLLFLNGQEMKQGATFDYTISGTTITWLASTGTAPDMTTADTLDAYYMS